MPSMPIENPGHMEVCILSRTEVATTIFYLHCKTAFWTRWHADMRCVPRCARAGQAPQTCCQLQPNPTGTASEKIAPRSSAARDLGSNCPTATKTHRSARDMWKKRCRWDDDAPRRTRKDGNRRKFESSIRSSTTAAALCVHVSFLPWFSHNSNCFGTHRPLRPTLPTQHYSHACPTCGTSVQSTIKSGRIQIKHKQPNGRTCSRTKWNTSWQESKRSTCRQQNRKARKDEQATESFLKSIET